MATPPHIHLFIPELLASLPLWQQDFGFHPEAPVLLALLANARHERLPVAGLERSLLHVAGYAVADALPWAGLRFRQQTGHSATGAVLCADPVCLNAGIDRITLLAQGPVLGNQEASSLLVSLNEHLALDGWQLLAVDSQHWYLQSHEDAPNPVPFPATTPLSEVGRQSVFPCLPQSADKYWQRLLNELQMLLHAHPVNQRREQQGLPVVNGLWLWGEGELPDNDGRHWPDAVMGGGDVGQVLAHHAGCAWQADWQADAGVRNFLILDTLVSPAIQDDPHAWQESLRQMESGSLAAVLADLQAGSGLSVYDCAGNVWECRPRDKWRFWQAKQADWKQLLRCC